MTSPQPSDPATQTSDTPPGIPGANVAFFVGASALLIVLADYAPRLVNGVLGLILAGVILKNADVWAPKLQAAVQQATRST